MEELLPLESYHAQSERTLRRTSRALGLAFGAALGAPFGISIGLALGTLTGVAVGVATAAFTGSAFAFQWGRSMLRSRRARNERAYENDPRLMGESLEDSFRYRMPCSLVEGGRLLPGTLYLDRDRAAFVPVRRLAEKVEVTRFSIAHSSLSVVPWREAPPWIRWTLGEPYTLQIGEGEGVRRFLTPDSDLAMARMRDVLPASLP